MVLMMATSPVVADKQKTSELPSLAFLEFLADMEMVEGEWVAPTDLLNAQNNPCAKVDSANVDVVSDSPKKTLQEGEVGEQSDDQASSDNQSIERVIQQTCQSQTKKEEEK